MTDARKTTVQDARLIPLSSHKTAVGDLVVFENDNPEHFVPRRVYYLYDIPSGAVRGGHAHRALEQIIVALSGSFEVVLDDGTEKSVVTLNQPNLGLRMPPGLWRELRGFSGGAICMVLASEDFSEEDYIRDQFTFHEWKLT